MAEVAARHLLGETQLQFLGADMSTKLKLMGVDVCSIGDAHGSAPGALNYVFTDEAAGVYKKLVVAEDRKQLLGAILVGDAADYGTLLQMALNPTAAARASRRADPAGDAKARRACGIDLLPDSALICSCNGVTQGRDLRRDRRAAAHRWARCRQATKAATSCGGCAPLVKQILDAELKKRGVEVNNHLCEHFALFAAGAVSSRTASTQLKTFDELIAQARPGQGCDICQPAVGSILASCWNE